MGLATVLALAAMQTLGQEAEPLRRRNSVYDDGATENVDTYPGYESLNFYLKLILWTMLLGQNLYHKIALEYNGKVFEYKFVTVGKKILNTNFQKCS